MMSVAVSSIDDNQHLFYVNAMATIRSTANGRLPEAYRPAAQGEDLKYPSRLLRERVEPRVFCAHQCGRLKY